MLILDAHCDTILRSFDQNYDFFENSGHLDIKRLYENKNSVQFFAAFVKPDFPGDALLKAIKLIDNFFQSVKEYREYIEIAYNTEDIKKIIKSGKTAAVITIEGGDVLLGELSVLNILYRLGIRALGLTWNHRNQIADGVLDDSGGGLTPFGKKVIARMNKLGMLIDVSHINKQGFWDVIKESKQPVIASHSNAQSLCSHVRNLDDNQLIALKENKGVTGINFYPPFLTEKPKASVEDVIKHIEYIASLIGPEHIGFGSDFDGISNTPKGLDGVEFIPDLINRLCQLNYTDEQIKMIAGENFMRVLKEVIG